MLGMLLLCALPCQVPDRVVNRKKMLFSLFPHVFDLVQPERREGRTYLGLQNLERICRNRSTPERITELNQIDQILGR